jgi:hypothetical protein
MRDCRDNLASVQQRKIQDKENIESGSWEKRSFTESSVRTAGATCAPIQDPPHLFRLTKVDVVGIDGKLTAELAPTLNPAGGKTTLKLRAWEGVAFSNCGAIGGDQSTAAVLVIR